MQVLEGEGIDLNLIGKPVKELEEWDMIQGKGKIEMDLGKISRAKKEYMAYLKLISTLTFVCCMEEALICEFQDGVMVKKLDEK